MKRLFLFILFITVPFFAHAEIYTKAELLIDLRTGSILHSKNADRRLQPASLTKLMTLYVTFEALRNREISLSDTTTISKYAASQPPSKIGMKPGQIITIADLIRGTAVQSANDAALALAEAVAGSEKEFVKRMNITAIRMGMKNTRYMNPHGLTHKDQLTTVHDLSILARHMYFDNREHYGLFSQKEITIQGRKYLSTNRKFLSNYKGATGLKTGYTRAAGYNLMASAERNNVVLLGIVLGAGSSNKRYQKVSQLLNQGFGEVSPLIASIAPSNLQDLNLVNININKGVTEHQPLRTALFSPIGTAFVSDIVAGHKKTNETKGTGTGLSLPDKGGFRPILISMNEDKGLWGVQIGLYPSRYLAEQNLLNITLSYIDTFGASPPSAAPVGKLWSAAFLHMSKNQAEESCRHLIETGQNCAIFKY